MGSVADNRAYYTQYDWRLGGSEWSIPWGSTRALWDFSLRPRLARYLPSQRIVEIGCGYGRISEHLRAQARTSIHLFDIMAECVGACERRFASDSRVHCFHSDGYSLPSVEAGSVDLIVSFYSLVHANAETLNQYLNEFRRALSPDGVAFVHHSNAGAYFEAGEAAHDPANGSPCAVP